MILVIPQLVREITRTEKRTYRCKVMRFEDEDLLWSPMEVYKPLPHSPELSVFQPQTAYWSKGEPYIIRGQGYGLVKGEVIYIVSNIRRR